MPALQKFLNGWNPRIRSKTLPASDRCAAQTAIDPALRARRVAGNRCNAEDVSGIPQLYCWARNPSFAMVVVRYNPYPGKSSFAFFRKDSFACESKLRTVD